MVGNWISFEEPAGISCLLCLSSTTPLSVSALSNCIAEGRWFEAGNPILLTYILKGKGVNS